jgi:hypothetical protein
MRKLTIITVLIAVLVLIVGCSGDAPAATPSQGNAFIGGTEGIIASFEPLSVKEEGIFTIFDSEDFPLEILLRNIGEENVGPNNVSLRLLGPAQNDFVNITSFFLNNSDDIEKISEFNPDGGEEIVTFTPNKNAMFVGDVTGFVDINWNVEYAYNYKTHVIVNDVCFKGDPTEDKVCETDEPKSFSVSAAPIQVTSVEQDTAGRGVMVVRINVNNAGPGNSALPGKKFDHRFAKLSFTVDDPETWECKSSGREGEARMSVDNSASIVCRLREPLQEEDLFTKNVRLTLDYTYKQLVQEKLRIKESVE